MLDTYIYMFRHTTARHRLPSASFGQKIRSPPLTVRNFRFRHGTRRVCCLCFVGDKGETWGNSTNGSLDVEFVNFLNICFDLIGFRG